MLFTAPDEGRARLKKSLVFGFGQKKIPVNWVVMYCLEQEMYKWMKSLIVIGNSSIGSYQLWQDHLLVYID